MADTKFKVDVHLRTSLEWQTKDYYLARNDIGKETDTGRQKIGVGLRWSDTPYDKGAVANMDTFTYVSGDVDPNTLYVVHDDNANMLVGDKPLTRNLDWRLSGKHFWPAYRDSMEATASGPAITPTFVQADTYYGDINGGCVLPDGRVFILAKDFLSPSAIYSPVTDSYSAVAPVFSAPPFFGNHSAGALPLPNGKVFIVPYWSGSRIAIYDPDTDTYEFSGGDWVLTSIQGVYHGIVMANGDIFLPPRKRPGAAIYHWKTGAVTEVPGPGATTPGFRGGTLLPDGRIFCAPYQTNQPYVYDPTDGTWLATATTTGNLHTGNCVVMADGRVFLPPFAGSANIYNPYDNTMESVPKAATMPGYGCICGALLPDGKVFLPPWDGHNFHVYDPATGEFALVGAGTSTAAHGRYNTAISMVDGRVGCWPDNVTEAAPVFPVFYGSTERAFDRNVILSPYQNGSR